MSKGGARFTEKDYAELISRKPHLRPTVPNPDPKKSERSGPLDENRQARPRGKGNRGSRVSSRFRVRVLLLALVPRRMDSDNLDGSLKAIRDAIADELQVDDGDEDSISFEYGQAETRGPAEVLSIMTIERR